MGNSKDSEREENKEQDLAKFQQKLTELSLVSDVPLEIIVTLGNAEITILDILQLQKGSVIELDKLAGEPLDITLKSRPVAKGEVVVINDKYGVRMTDIIG